MFRIAICQFSPELNNIKANMREIKDQLKKAKQTNADIAIFPELALSGFYNHNQFFEISEQIQSKKSLESIMKVSSQLDIDTVIGYPRMHGNEIFNSAAYIQKGKLLSVHDKIYLANYPPFNEKKYFSSGEKVTVLDTDFGRIAMLISEDAWHLSTSLIASQLGAKLIIICSATAVEDRQKLYKVQYSWETVNTAIAFSQSMYVVYNNRSGSENGLAFWGGSHVIDFAGKMVKKAKIFSADISYVDIDLQLLDAQRNEFSRVAEEKNTITLTQLRGSE